MKSFSITLLAFAFLISCTKNLNEPTVEPGVDTAVLSSDASLGTKMNIVGAYGKGDTRYTPANMLDGRTSTIWSSTLSDAFTGKLDSLRIITAVRIAFHTGDKASYKFDFKISKDSINWVTVLSNQSSKAGVVDYQNFSFDSTQGRYIRIIGKGNDKAYPLANSYTDIEVYGAGIVTPPIVDTTKLSFFSFSDTRIKYMGRWQEPDKTKQMYTFANPGWNRAWMPGASVAIKFTGVKASFILNDMQFSNATAWSKNYITYVVDGVKTRVMLPAKRDTVIITGLSSGTHELLICKGTESSQGYIEFVGVQAAGLVQVEDRESILVIGDSQSGGVFSNLSEFQCGQGQWWQQTDAYMSYGAQAARILGMNWILQANGNIGISVKNKVPFTMNDAFDKLCSFDNSVPYDLTKEKPKYIVIMLGQNDGWTDSATYVNDFIRLVNRVKNTYTGKILLCSSAMAEPNLSAVLKRRIQAVAGVTGVNYFEWSQRYNGPCTDHPTVSQQTQMGIELANRLKTF